MTNYSIHKYKIPSEHVFHLELPAGAKILTVQTQRVRKIHESNNPSEYCVDRPYIWAMVPISDRLNAPIAKEERILILFGTDQTLREEEYNQVMEGTLKYIGTFQLQGDSLYTILPDGARVFHLFEDTSEKV